MSVSRRAAPRDPLEGKRAPAFTALDQEGRQISLKDLQGRPVVLYFYPKDFTPGCTVEACDFRDHWRQVRATGAVVLGVSKDSVRLHKRFVEKMNLPFNLIADEHGAVCRKYKVIAMKSLYGRIFKGIVRSTFVIDGKGVVRKVFRGVKVNGHVEEVLAAVRALS